MKKEDLSIVFMGTPDFAVASLRAIVEEGYKVVGVVTQPDKPVGRHGSLLQAPPVKRFALERGIPVMQSKKMKDEAFVSELRGLGANLFVVVAFRMLPEVVWTMPKYGTFNVHASLLPQYRGAAPINWAVINGETMTGITTFMLDHQIDTGRILMQRPFPIPPSCNAGYVHDGLMELGAKTCLETIEAIIAADGNPETKAQPDTLEPLRHAPKIFKETCRIDWSRPTEEIHNLVRGLSPSPGAWTTMEGPDGRETVLKIFSSRPSDVQAEGAEGCTLQIVGRQLLACRQGHQPLDIIELQAAGKRRMTATDFINGIKSQEKFVRLK